MSSDPRAEKRRTILRHIDVLLKVLSERHDLYREENALSDALFVEGVIVKVQNIRAEIA